MSRGARRGAIVSATLLLSACASLPPRPVVVAPTPVFSPETFFAGRTRGEGTLRIVAHRRRSVRVDGAGYVRADGTLVLSQRVTQGNAAPRTREWRIRSVAPGRYAGTLSDAVGPVIGDVEGNRLRLRFRMAGGLAAEQRLYLLPGGRVARNRLTVRKLGIVVAVLDEMIARVD